ncbi:hypothetical protein FB451DRAFT_1416141 [Mycena latifolia]|nr:hypothetical protein FB451DRAFT_1416141 [Mycena latifolia]
MFMHATQLNLVPSTACAFGVPGSLQFLLLLHLQVAPDLFNRPGLVNLRSRLLPGLEERVSGFIFIFWPGLKIIIFNPKAYGVELKVLPFVFLNLAVIN